MAQPQHAPALHVQDLPFAGKFSLRCRDQTRPDVAKALGISLPAAIGQTSQTGPRQAICLGPDEWMILCPEAERNDVAQASLALSQTVPHSLVDISFREVGISISGRQAAEVIGLYCARDLRGWAVGQAARTLFDTVQAVLMRPDATEFHLYVWRSYHPHTRHLLRVGKAELATGL